MTKRPAILIIAILCGIFFTTLAVAKIKSSQSSWLLQSKKAKEAKLEHREVELKPNHDFYSEIETGMVNLRADRLLVTVNGTLYLLNGKKEVVWENEIIDMIGLPIVDSLGRVYGIAGDVKQFAVNKETGDVSHFGPGYGGTHSYYTQIKPYRDGQHLVIESMQHYRENNTCYPKCPYAADKLEAWDGESLLWSTPFPANAELHVWDSRILAFSRKADRVVIEEIEVPGNKTNAHAQYLRAKFDTNRRLAAPQCDRAAPPAQRSGRALYRQRISNLSMTFALCLLLPPGVAGQTSASTSTQIRAINSYAKQIDLFIKRNPKARRLFGDVSSAMEDGPSNWRAFKSVAARNKAADGNNMNQSAYVWLKANKVVRVDLELTSPSGDWFHFVTYYFRDDGSTAKVRAQLNTFYGNFTLRREQYHNAEGKLIHSTARYFNLFTKKPIKPKEDLPEFPIPNFLKVQDLPFHSLL